MNNQRRHQRAKPYGGVASDVSVASPPRPFAKRKGHRAVVPDKPAKDHPIMAVPPSAVSGDKGTITVYATLLPPDDTQPLEIPVKVTNVKPRRLVCVVKGYRPYHGTLFAQPPRRLGQPRRKKTQHATRQENRGQQL